MMDEHQNELFRMLTTAELPWPHGAVEPPEWRQRMQPRGMGLRVHTSSPALDGSAVSVFIELTGTSFIILRCE